jgi:subtilase family serine protease
MSFYLSNNTILDDSDTLLGSRTVSALSPGETDSGTTSVNIPGGTITGRYYIIAKADSFNEVTETNENNNKRFKAIKIGPDLIVSSLSASSKAAAAQSIDVKDTTKNNGPVQQVHLQRVSISQPML